MVTGGYSSKKVTQYTPNGEEKDLADLRTGRHNHACAKYVDNGDTVS